jgi:hypothetical protein
MKKSKKIKHNNTSSAKAKISNVKARKKAQPDLNLNTEPIEENHHKMFMNSEIMEIEEPIDELKTEHTFLDGLTDEDIQEEADDYLKGAGAGTVDGE